MPTRHLPAGSLTPLPPCLCCRSALQLCRRPPEQLLAKYVAGHIMPARWEGEHASTQAYAVEDSWFRQVLFVVAEQSRAEQSRAEQSRAEQSRAGRTHGTA